MIMEVGDAEMGDEASASGFNNDFNNNGDDGVGGGGGGEGGLEDRAPSPPLGVSAAVPYPEIDDACCRFLRAAVESDHWKNDQLIRVNLKNALPILDAACCVSRNSSFSDSIAAYANDCASSHVMPFIRGLLKTCKDVDPEAVSAEGALITLEALHAVKRKRGFFVSAERRVATMLTNVRISTASYFGFTPSMVGRATEGRKNVLWAFIEGEWVKGKRMDNDEQEDIDVHFPSIGEEVTYTHKAYNEMWDLHAESECQRIHRGLMASWAAQELCLSIHGLPSVEKMLDIALKCFCHLMSVSTVSKKIKDFSTFMNGKRGAFRKATLLASGVCEVLSLGGRRKFAADASSSLGIFRDFICGRKASSDHPVLDHMVDFAYHGEVAMLMRCMLILGETIEYGPVQRCVKFLTGTQLPSGLWGESLSSSSSVDRWRKGVLCVKALVMRDGAIGSDGALPNVGMPPRLLSANDKKSVEDMGAFAHFSAKLLSANADDDVMRRVSEAYPNATAMEEEPKRLYYESHAKLDELLRWAKDSE